MALTSRKSVILIAREHADALRALLASLPEQPEVSVLVEPAALMDLPRERRIDLLFLDADLLQEGEIPWLRRTLEGRKPSIPLILAFSGRGAAAARGLQDLSACVAWKPYLLGEVFAAAQEALLGKTRPAALSGTKSPPPELVRGLADELNNPLATISGYLQLLSLDLGKSAAGETGEKLAAIRDGLERIGRTVEQLSLASGSRRAKKVPVDLLALLREESKAWKAQHKELVLRIPESGPKASISGDPKLLAAAIEEMGAFLQSCTEGKSEVRISIQRPESGELQLMWSVPTHILPGNAFASLFDPYALNSLGIPAGLSLAALRGILRVHGGETLASIGENGALELRWIFPTRE